VLVYVVTPVGANKTRILSLWDRSLTILELFIHILEREDETMAENQTSADESKRRMWRLISENAQTIGIVLSLALGLRDKPAPGSDEEKSLPGWFVSALPGLTDIDEIWQNLIIDSHPDRRIKAIERAFRKKASYDPEMRYDIEKYRTRLLGMRREYIELLLKTAPKNEQGNRLQVEPLMLRDSCYEFFTELIEEVDRLGNTDEIYQRQKEIALYRNILVPMGSIKKTLHAAGNNKLPSLSVIIMIITLLLCGIFWIPYCLLLLTN
jgi:hypothetical protein